MLILQNYSISPIKLHENKYVDNTTIGAIITNARFDKSQLCKIAGMTHNGYARSIRPVHTSADGDSIYALSVGTVAADCDMVGTLELMSCQKRSSVLFEVQNRLMVILRFVILNFKFKTSGGFYYVFYREVSEMFGLPVSTLRYYDKEGLFRI